MLLSNRTSCRRFRRGVATVEFALTVPILFLVVFGLVEIGRGLMVEQLLSNAARDGARSAILGGATVADVETEVNSYLSGSEVTGTTITVTPNPLTAAQGGDPVTVSVSVPYSSISWLPTPRYLSGIVLESSVTMRREVFTTPPEVEE